MAVSQATEESAAKIESEQTPQLWLNVEMGLARARSRPPAHPPTFRFSLFSALPVLPRRALARGNGSLHSERSKDGYTRIVAAQAAPPWAFQVDICVVRRRCCWPPGAGELIRPLAKIELEGP